MKVRGILSFFGIIPAYTEDDILNAENENDLRDHREALEAARTVAKDRIETNRVLRTVLNESRMRSREFEQFEELLRKEADRVRGNTQ